MSGLTESEKKEAAAIMGKVMAEEFIKIANAMTQNQEKNKAVGDARWEVMQTKLDTIIAELRR